MSYLGLALVILVIIGACFVSFLLADRIERMMGDTAAVVVTRLLGVLLAALSIQFIADGIRAMIAVS